MSQTNSTTQATQTHSEAPASASAKMISPNGIEWLLTARDDTVNGLLKKIGVMEDHLLRDGWQPARNGGPARTSAAQAPARDAPVCEFHGPMKESTKHPGTWFCPAKMGDGSYCKSKA